jgi:hypothetical protein
MPPGSDESIETIVRSHGHFDHGWDRRARAQAWPDRPASPHPPALLAPAADCAAGPRPATNSVLITGEVARTTGYEPGFPPQQAYLDGAWEPDPLVLDDQAMIVNVGRHRVPPVAARHLCRPPGE